MFLPLFIARRIFSDKGDRRKVSRPAIRIATIGVAIGLAVMIVTVSVVLGFKHTIRDKVVGFGSHIQVQNVQAAYNPVASISIDSTALPTMEGITGVNHAQRFCWAQGILKTDDDFLGVMLKGVGPEYDTRFLESCLQEGELPQFSDSATQYPLVVSKSMADKLRIHAGDRIFAYFIDDDVRVRKFNVCAVYQTNMKRFDDLICLTDLYVTRKLNGYSSDECSGLELLVSDFDRLDETKRNVSAELRKRPDMAGNFMAPQTIMESYPQVFSWLELLDINVWIILALMIAVAGFTMISGLLIIILERTQMIGILKALGARNSMIGKTFLWFGAFIISRGLLLGNVLGLGIVILQQQTGLVTLDPQTYYVSEAPMELSLPLILLLNVSTLLISVLVLVLPSLLVMFIRPAQSMRYD
ncbi:MAG: ABC transporter permease [Prevotella sp.]|nr:ABC transporter permease [Prevotella sp.]MBR1755849.1 ABC transporter permease [Bacteroidaceae bacterium]